MRGTCALAQGRAPVPQGGGTRHGTAGGRKSARGRPRGRLPPDGNTHPEPAAVAPTRCRRARDGRTVPTCALIPGPVFKRSRPARRGSRTCRRPRRGGSRRSPDHAREPARHRAPRPILDRHRPRLLDARQARRLHPGAARRRAFSAPGDPHPTRHPQPDPRTARHRPDQPRAPRAGPALRHHLTLTDRADGGCVRNRGRAGDSRPGLIAKRAGGGPCGAMRRAASRAAVAFRSRVCVTWVGADGPCCG